MNNRISAFYEDLFLAEEDNDFGAMAAARKNIEEALTGSSSDLDIPKSGEENVEIFLEAVGRKPFYQTFRSVWEGAEVDDIRLGVALSSFITNALIETSKDVSAFNSLKSSAASELLTRYLTGKVSGEVVKKFISEDLSFLRLSS